MYTHLTCNRSAYSYFYVSLLAFVDNVSCLQFAQPSRFEIRLQQLYELLSNWS